MLEVEPTGNRVLALTYRGYSGRKPCLFYPEKKGFFFYQLRIKTDPKSMYLETFFVKAVQHP